MPLCSSINATLRTSMANYSDVNFIKHLLSVSEKFMDDERLGPLHVSLYYAVFQSWNLAKFRNPISVNREELMRASKIGSANTYTKCLKELDAWGYVKYTPSFNPHKGSQIYLYTFNKATDHAIDISTHKGTEKATEKGSGKAPAKEVIPSKNNSNKTNKQTKKNGYEHAGKKGDPKSSFVTPKFSDEPGRERKKVARKKESAGAGFKRPLLQAVSNYFAAHEWSDSEAQKFFHYYQSNGWLVGGKTPMRSWEDAAAKWMLNANNFNHEKDKGKQQPTGNRARQLNTTNDKDYSEPL